MIFFQYTKNNKKGFTLIELLVVISIVSLLSSIILGSLTTARAKGRDAARSRDLQQLKMALELYYDDHGYYPPDYGGNSNVETSTGAITSTNGCNTSKDWPSGGLSELVPNYMPQLPKDPLNNSQYCYRYEPAGTNSSQPANACVWTTYETGFRRIRGIIAGSPVDMYTGYMTSLSSSPIGYECYQDWTLFEGYGAY